MIKDAGVGLCEPGCSEFEIRLQNVERKPYSVILNAVKDLARSPARLGDESRLLRLHPVRQVGNALHRLDRRPRALRLRAQAGVEGFTRKYRVTRLVYVEEFDRAADMVARERQFKGWTRRRKLALIHTQNPEMVDYARRTARDPSLRSG